MRCGTGKAGITWASACKTWACAWRKAAAAASTSCWGVASQIVGFGACYVALGLLTGNDSRRHPSRVSRNASCGRLMHSSITFGSDSNGRSARNVRASAVTLALASASGSRSQLIHGSEVQIPRHQDLNPVPVALDHRGRNSDGVLEYLR